MYHFRFSAAVPSCYAFNSYFITMLLNSNKEDQMKHWPGKRNIKIFEKKMLLFPFFSASHWSLYVVINPSCIKTGYSGRKQHEEMPFLLHLDSLGKNSPHLRSTADRNLRMWLNKVWQIESDNEYETSMPFSKHTLKCISPKGELQK